jgi:hypothetical protein
MPEIGQTVSHYRIIEKIGAWGPCEVSLADGAPCRAVTRWLPPLPLAKSPGRNCLLKPLTWRPSPCEPLALPGADRCQTDHSGLVRQQDQTCSRGLPSGTRWEPLHPRNPGSPRVRLYGSVIFVQI